MFTFSFSSAFAAIAAGDAPDTISDSYFENLWADFVKVTTDSETIAIDTYNVDKAVVAGFKTEAKAAYDAYMQTATGYVTEADTFKGVILGDTTKAKAFKLAVAAAQFAADKNDAIAKLGTVPTYNYSTEAMSSTEATKAEAATNDKVKFVDKDYTYQKAAEKLVEFFKGEVEDLDDFNADVAVANYKKASEDIADILDNAVYPVCTEATVSSTTVITSTGNYDLKVAYSGPAVKTGDVDGKGTTISYVLFDATSNWSTKGVDTGNKTEAADVAAKKAANAAAYARYIAENPKNTEYADKWLKVANVLAEENIAATEPDGTVYAKKADAIKELEDYAAKYGAEKNAQGQLIRDAAKVQKYLEKGTVAIAKAADNDATAAALETAKTNILNAKSEMIANELTFVKDSAKKAMELTISDAEKDETYYEAELAKVKEYAATYTAKVEAAEDKADVKDAYEKFLEKVADVSEAADLNTTWKTQMTTEGKAAKVLYDAANAYVVFVNNDKTDTSGDYVDSDVLKARLAEMIGKSGVRTEKEIKALKDEALKVAQALPTNDAVKTAKKAAEDAIKAIPTKVTVADLAAVQAASDAIKAYVDLKGDAAAISNKTSYNTAVTQLVNAYNSQFAQQVAKLSTTDEAAIKATITDIDAALDTLDALKEATPSKTFLQGLKDKLNGNDYLGKIKTNEKKAVEDAIKAIPLNVTEADKATVENARKLYDAYVAKYNDYEALYNTTGTPVDADYTKGYAADDFTDISALTAAETVLGLNAVDPAELVKGLKLTAKSTAKKGSITVTWTVKGDASVADGFQVWKSTKQSKGYKKAFTTTKQSYKNTKGLKKGTRYYYKVRAYKVVDGKNVYSDWSNKAYRKAK